MTDDLRGASPPPDLTSLAASDLSTRLRLREVSARDVMTAYLDRIETLNPAINAIVSLRPREELLAEADAADLAPASGPLHGLPVAVKDLVATKSLRTTWGSPLFADHIPEADDRLARRLRRAGAMLIGKTNVPEFGAGSHSFNPVFGVTRNPYDHARTAGGSSGGAAAALAMRMVPVADGSDMMGSLRNPAAFCNIYGFRPTWGLIPDDAEGDLYLHRLATDGPMARCPKDLALLLSALAGPDPKMPYEVAVPDLSTLDPEALKGARIGWLSGWDSVPYEDGILDTCEAALAEMTTLGAMVETLPPPLSRDEVWESWTTLRSWAIAAGKADLWNDASKRQYIKPELQWEIGRGNAMTALQVDRASRIRSRLNLAVADLFRSYDALAIPSAQVWPFPTDWRWPECVGGVAMDSYHRWMECVIPVSLTGLPAVSVPAGFGENGLPTGITLFGPRNADRRILSVADHWHQATDWPNRRPPPEG